MKKDDVCEEIPAQVDEYSNKCNAEQHNQGCHGGHRGNEICNKHQYLRERERERERETDRQTDKQTDRERITCIGLDSYAVLFIPSTRWSSKRFMGTTARPNYTYIPEKSALCAKQKIRKIAFETE